MISFARGAPAPECLDSELLADCARSAIEGDPSVLAYGAGGGYGPLREWLGARHGVEPGARHRHERRPPGLRLLRGGAAGGTSRPRPRRGADLRPAAEDPRPPRSRGRAGARWTSKGSTPTRWRRHSTPGRRASSTRSRPFRIRAGGHCRPRDASGSSSSRRNEACRCSRTIRMAWCATRARRRRRCTSSRAGTSSPTPPPSRRPSPRACAWAGSSRPPTWQRGSRPAPSRRTSRRRSSHRRPCTS